MIRLILLGLFALIGITTAEAQNTSPEEVSRHLSLAYKNSDFEQVATLMHPDALVQFQDLLLEIASLDSSGAVITMLLGESAPDSIANLQAKDVFVRFMKAVYTLRPEIAEGLGSLEADVLGHVLEGDSLAHVISRNHISMMGMQMTKMEVVSFKRYGEGWLGLLSGNLTNIAEAVRANLKKKQGE